MNDVLREAYEACEVGASTVVKPATADADGLNSFQGVLRAAEIMSAEGLIHIDVIHKESQTSKRFVDRFRFIRLR